LFTIFTIPDPTLNQDSSVDPMGLQLIWTGLGQKIFESRITTIANDLRVFNFNLLHHAVIYQLLLENSEIRNNRRFRVWRSDIDVKAGLLMFLEDMVTHVFYEASEGPEGDEIEKLGILGLSKARREYARGLDALVITASKRSGLLKNQLNLGMTGRYKGPMMNMGYFNRNFEYLKGFKEEIDRLFGTWPEAMELQRTLKNLLGEAMENSISKDAPSLYLSELKSRKIWKLVSQGYITCFSSRKLNPAIGRYWQDKLGLNSGAARALYQTTEQHILEPLINHELHFIDALHRSYLDTADKEQLQTILNIEPFLSHSEYLLRFISQHGVKRLQDVQTDLEQLRTVIRESARFAIPQDAPRRLTELVDVMTGDEAMITWLKNVLNYHTRIMKMRGGHEWLELSDDGIFRHYFGPPLGGDRHTMERYLQNKPWLHTYYLETLRNIYRGLN
jgi:hypothetical protein